MITTEAFLATSVYAADVDGDGDVDMLSASSSDDKIAWYENRLAGDLDDNGLGHQHPWTCFAGRDLKAAEKDVWMAIAGMPRPKQARFFGLGIPPLDGESLPRPTTCTIHGPGAYLTLGLRLLLEFTLERLFSA